MYNLRNDICDSCCWETICTIMAATPIDIKNPKDWLEELIQESPGEDFDSFSSWKERMQARLAEKKTNRRQSGSMQAPQVKIVGFEPKRNCELISGSENCNGARGGKSSLQNPTKISSFQKGLLFVSLSSPHKLDSGCKQQWRRKIEYWTRNFAGRPITEERFDLNYGK